MSACGNGDKKFFSDYFHVTLERNLHNGVFEHIFFLFFVCEVLNDLSSLCLTVKFVKFKKKRRKMCSISSRVSKYSRILCLMKYATNLSLITRANDVER